MEREKTQQKDITWKLVEDFQQKHLKIFFDGKRKKSRKGYYLETGWRFSIEIPLCRCALASLNLSSQYTFRNISQKFINLKKLKYMNIDLLKVPSVEKHMQYLVNSQSCWKSTLLEVSSVCSTGDTNTIVPGP